MKFIYNFSWQVEYVVAFAKKNRSEYNLHLATAKSSLGGVFSFAFAGSQLFRIILGYSRIGLALEMI